VQRVDGYYAYRVGYQIHNLAVLSGSSGVFGGASTKYREAWQPLFVAEGALTQLLYNSIYNLRTSVHSGEILLSILRNLQAKVSVSEDAEKELEFMDIFPMQQALGNFEQVLQAELALVPLYIVTPKKGFDTGLLIEAGRVIFPDDLTEKVPESIEDIERDTVYCFCVAYGGRFPLPSRK
jgi:hypothetical protein